MNSKIVWPIVGVVSILAALLAFVVRPLPAGVDRESAAKIQIGMTRAEVERLIGPYGFMVEGAGIPSDRRMQERLALMAPNVSGIGLIWWVDERTTVLIAFGSEIAAPDLDEERVLDFEVRDTEIVSRGEYLWWRLRRSIGFR